MHGAACSDQELRRIDKEVRGILEGNKRYIMKKAPVSANSVGIGCLAVLGLLWLLSFLLSGAALASTAYVRWKTLPLRQAVLPVSCTPDPANDGALIHIDCPIRPKTAFVTPSEFDANVPKVDGVFLEIHVEMFQRGAGLLRAAAPEWYDHLVDDSIDYFPYIGGAGRRFATEVYAGGFRIANTDVMTSFHGKKLIPLKEDGRYEPSIERPPLKISSRNTRVFGNSLYTGDPYHPAIGDVRITFYGSSATHVSAIGIQEPSMKLLQMIGAGDHYIKGFPDVFAVDGDDNVRIHRLIAQEGDLPAKELITQYERQNNAFQPFYWFALVNFAVTTALLMIFVLRKIRQGGEAAARASLLDMGVAGVCITLGCLLTTASVPNLVGYYVRGTIQFVAGLAFVAGGIWVDVQSQNGVSLFNSRRPYSLLPRHEPKSNEVALLGSKPRHSKKKYEQTAYVPL